jgi:hypothetical protein
MQHFVDSVYLILARDYDDLGRKFEKPGRTHWAHVLHFAFIGIAAMS